MGRLPGRFVSWISAQLLFAIDNPATALASLVNDAPVNSVAVPRPRADVGENRLSNLIHRQGLQARCPHRAIVRTRSAVLDPLLNSPVVMVQIAVAHAINEETSVTNSCRFPSGAAWKQIFL